jgi:hypothetical protein
MKKFLAVGVMLVLGLAQLPARAENPAEDTFGEVNASKFWLKMNAGYGMVALDDFKKATLPFINTALDLGWSTAEASMGGWSLDGMFEIGKNLDAGNALALRWEYLLPTMFSGKANFDIQQFTRKLQPLAFSFSLNYYRYFPAGDHRYFITGGVGYYEALVIHQYVAPYNSSTGIFCGNTFGGNLGFGSEWLISRNLGLEFSLNGRYARISKVEADSHSETTGGPGGTTAIVATPDGNIFSDLESNMAANNEHYVPVDFTGFDVRIGLNIYIL